MAQEEGKGAERFMAKWIATEKANAGLRHVVVIPERDGKDDTRLPKCVIFGELWRGARASLGARKKS